MRRGCSALALIPAGGSAILGLYLTLAGDLENSSLMLASGLLWLSMEVGARHGR
jgi:hypothetical protein